ncbi:MAG TPA: hypothetical protein VFV55_02940 [Usitatibacteraceae bacterium]|nr:hypothetical protein [Usitatibacteraceae bacterium]
MSPNQRKQWKPPVRLDSVANAFVLAAALLVVLFAAGTAHFDAEPLRMADRQAEVRIVADASSPTR